MMLMDAYVRIVAFSWYYLIDMDCISLHVKFEVRLSFSLLRNMTTRYEKLELETKSFSKPQNI